MHDAGGQAGRLKRVGPTLLLFEIQATSFLRHMVRGIVGTLVEAGLGKMNAADMKDILEARDRSRAGADSSGPRPVFKGSPLRLMVLQGRAVAGSCIACSGMSAVRQGRGCFSLAHGALQQHPEILRSDGGLPGWRKPDSFQSVRALRGERPWPNPQYSRMCAQAHRR